MDVRSTIHGLIDAFRSHAEELTPSHFGNFGVFEEPTQAIIFQLRSPNVAIIFFTHFSDEPDKRVTTIADIEFPEALDALPRLWTQFETKMVANFFPNESNISLSHVIQETFKSFFSNLAMSISRGGTKFLSGFPSREVATLEAHCESARIDYEGLLRRVLESTKLVHSPWLYFKSSEQPRKAYFGRFVPRAFVGDRPPKTFKEETEEKWTGPDLWGLREPLWITSYRSIPVTIFAGGMVVADSRHSDKALDAVNTFLAAANVVGIVCVPFTESELGDMEIGTAGDIRSYGGMPEVGRHLSLAADRTIKVEDLQRAIKLLESIRENDQLGTQLKLHHAAFVHLYVGEHLQACVLSWNVVETWLQNLWNEYVSSRVVDEKRVGKLQRWQDFTADHMIEVLTLAGRIPQDVYPTLQTLRKIRNRTIHGASVPSRDETTECLHFSGRILSQTLKAMRSGRQS